jgi:hypothetical protein
MPTAARTKKRTRKPAASTLRSAALPQAHLIDVVEWFR